MEYTVQKLAQLAGISTRTLRYYDEIGLLKPARINTSGYRIYGQQQVDTLQQIMFYRELGVGLEDIKVILNSGSFNATQALEEHREKLLERRKQLDLLIANVEKTLVMVEGGIRMTDKEKFEGFKQKMIDDNEKQYGQEIRARYGDQQVEASNKKVKGMSQEQYAEVERLGAAVKATLAKAFATGDPAGELAQKAVDLHRQWLCFFWNDYSKEAHAGLGQMYVDDPRFTAYYDTDQPGTAAFFRDAILIYTGIRKAPQC
ncbi:MAG TPA: MerR family transcriptional regulator [Bacillota bacterium]|nr:MerR family transcriptional regulator [Bacillota bacterium]